MFNLGVVIAALYGDINKIKNYTISIQVLIHGKLPPSEMY
jgi:hypothetical protein